jgi:putative acyl-CoA dehydrogenase
MSDAFLTLAQLQDQLTCFLVPRWRPDGCRNAIQLQRLKDKLGNRANASSEIEYHGAWARRLGEPGRGIATIIEMVHHTRLHTSVAPASLMRQGLALATHHASHRRVFGRRLIEQPLLRQVLADLALESEAATALAFRLARGFDASARDPGERRFARLAVSVVKYWINKRAPGHLAECLECLGGGGYVEESLLPRLYREAPLNGIWEGSGNVICLDFLRALERDPEGRGLLMDEVVAARGFHPLLDQALERLAGALSAPTEASARRLAGELAVTLAASLLARHAPEPVAVAYLRSRLGETPQRCYGELPSGLDLDPLLQRILAEP